jgi:hypothetical protein
MIHRKGMEKYQPPRLNSLRAWGYALQATTPQVAR